MRIELPEAALDFGRVADSALRGAGGIDLARDAESDPRAAAKAEECLASIGLYDIDPRDGLDDAVAAAELCRVGGSHAVPFPLAGILLRTSPGTPFALVDAQHPVIDHALAAGTWTAATLAGDLFDAEPVTAVDSKIAPFAMTAKLRPLAGTATVLDRRLSLVLGAYHLLGIGQRALKLAIGHTKVRKQFGQPLSDFQMIRHSLADQSVGLEGLDLLCRFSLWSTFTDSSPSLVDALSVRLEAQRVVKHTLRVAQQLHGASGFADEYDISILVRHAQPGLRLPTDRGTTLALLRTAIEEYGFAGPFSLTEEQGAG
ncbi:acyl-CoA dehydrogenase family protein [Acrocarpospora macrocephala]|uniref:Acyl-CoA dehydrogenase n=1 Tax=Acrocarpospora macrocephala TaxID=150177 RepID=A0A5M3WL66_9ACTN|nr:acyl-CoA dehydrogenase family protein [Acrocarpospora macrocephala]GES07028.1 acyl-CoA dehydrogenase [Acrocarpospora macrocephala]